MCVCMSTGKKYDLRKPATTEQGEQEIAFLEHGRGAWQDAAAEVDNLRGLYKDEVDQRTALEEALENLRRDYEAKLNATAFDLRSWVGRSQKKEAQARAAEEGTASKPCSVKFSFAAFWSCVLCCTSWLSDDC